MPEEIDVEPVVSNEEQGADASFVQNIFDETERRALLIIDEISKKSAELTERKLELDEKEQALNDRECALNARENNMGNNELKKEWTVVSSYIAKTTDKMSSEQIRSLGKDYWLSLIDRVKEIAKIIGGGLDAHESWHISKIYLVFQLFDEYYYEVCNMAKHGFPIWKSEVNTVIENSYLRSSLKDLLNDYIAQHGTSERADEYRELVSLLEG